jgi:hypothetical protein
MRRSGSGRPKNDSQRPEIRVDLLAIVMHEGYSAVIAHGPNTELELRGTPHIVLITKSDCLSRTAPQRAYEVVGKTQMRSMAHDLDGKGRAGGKSLDHGEGAVGRMIVADNQLTREKCLPSETIELLAQPGLPVMRR